MKQLTLAACASTFTLAILLSAGTTFSQVPSVVAANKQSAKSTEAAKTGTSGSNATRVRVWGDDLKPSTSPPVNSSNEGQSLQAHAKGGLSGPPAARSETPGSLSNLANRSRTVSPTAPKINVPVPNAILAAKSIVPAVSQFYRVGVRDVLDIQLAGASGKQSTLFTVIEGGMLEYPLAGGPIQAAGLTTAEVADLLRERIKILDNPTINVNVRDFASHTVTVTGFVGAPGVKNLRREAVPLYTILAEALMLPEAARATINRQGRAPIMVDLKDSDAAASLVLPGDVIKVSGMPPGPTEFLFVGGEINSAGQKPYHAGVTLTQAILASGGTTKAAGQRVRVARQGADGRLITEEYNLRKIQDGKIPDPVLQPGDRIQVGESR